MKYIKVMKLKLNNGQVIPVTASVARIERAGGVKLFLADALIAIYAPLIPYMRERAPALNC